MKTAEAKTTSVATAKKANQPFFSKKAEGSFFGESVNKESSFFKPASAYSVNGNGVLQTKITIGQPNDKYEQEADAMADKVVQRLATPEPIAKKETAVQTKPLAAGTTPLIQTKCAACEKEEKLQKKEWEDQKRLTGNKDQKRSISGTLQMQSIGGPALASTSFAPSSALPASVIQQWQSSISSNLLSATNIIVQEMIRRGEIDPSIYRVQQVATGASQCRTPNPQLIEINSSVNGANTTKCSCVTVGTFKYANPRISIHPDLVQFRNLGSTMPQTDASKLHSTLLHEFRHVRQDYEECNTPGSVTSSGVCTDCNNPEEMDAYLTEIEAGYNKWVIMDAWIRVHVNWDFLSPAQQNVFLTRKRSAEQKVNRLFQGVTWNTNNKVNLYRQWCQSLQGGSVGMCNSFMAPVGQTGSSQAVPAQSRPSSGNNTILGKESNY